MFNNFNRFVEFSNQKIAIAKEYSEKFRLYNVGSFAVNHLVSNKGFRKVIDLSYGHHERHKLDLYRTEQPKTLRPLIVFVHGGAWDSGDKKDYHFLGQTFATEGYDVAIINYRLAPNDIFPAYVDDLVLALDYLTDHQSELGIQSQNMILLGHSAGAFNIMSAVYYPHQDGAYKRQENIKAIIGLAGPYHFDYKDDPLCADAFDQNVPYQQVMPYYFVHNNHIRHYLLMAEHDQIVADWNAVDLNEALNQQDNHSQIVVVPKTGHITIMGSVSSLFSSFFQTKTEILRAIDEALSEA
jgi:acetyl esterase/lipase